MRSKKHELKAYLIEGRVSCDSMFCGCKNSAALTTIQYHHLKYDKWSPALMHKNVRPKTIFHKTNNLHTNDMKQRTT